MRLLVEIGREYARNLRVQDLELPVRDGYMVRYGVGYILDGMHGGNRRLGGGVLYVEHGDEVTVYVLIARR